MTINYKATFLLLGFLMTGLPVIAQQKKKETKPKTTPAKTIKATVKTVKPITKTEKVPVKTAPADTIPKTGANGQPPATPGGLNEEIIITSTYKPVLADAVKIRRNPNLNDKQDFKPKFAYTNLLDKRLNINTGIKQLEAQQLPKTADDTLYNNYAKLGVGNLTTTFGEIYVDNGRDQALQVGAYAKHFAQLGSLPKQNASRQEVGVFGKAINDQNTISGRLNYTRRSNYFYGFDEDHPPTNLIPGKQHFNTISGEAEINKNFEDKENAFVYSAKISAYGFSNAYKARENNILIDVAINQTIKQFYAGLNASVDAGNSKDSLYNVSNNIFRVNPYLKLQGANYKINVGVNLVSVFGFNTSLRLFPAADIEFQVVPKYVQIFAELQGDVNKTTLKNFSEENPFIGQNIDIKNSVNRYTISAGLKGTAAPGLGFKAAFIRQSITDLPLFVNNFNFAAGQNKFLVIYDTGRSTVTGFNGDLDFKASETLDLYGRLEYRKYDLATQQEAWNLPTFKLTAGTDIHLNKKITINGLLLIRGDVIARLPSAVSTTGYQAVSLPSFADLSGGVSYKLNKRVAFFAQANNLLNNKYQTYLYYPVNGFNIFGGLSVGF